MRTRTLRLIAIATAGLLVASLCHAEKASADSRKKLVLLVADREYETPRTLPKFAAQFLEKEFRTVMVSSTAGAEQTGFERIKEITDADVLLVSVRRRTPPKAQLDTIRAYIKAGKPVVGIRTASHAFFLGRGQSLAEGNACWPDWDAEVFGGNYTGHHAKGIRTNITAADGGKHPLLRNVQLPFVSPSWLYKVSPLKSGTVVLMMGAIDGHPAEPVAWTFQRADGGKSFYTSLGHPDDFDQPAFQILLATAIKWAAGM